MEESALGNHLLGQWLGEVRQAVEQEGELTKAAIENLVEHFGGTPNSLTQELEELRLELQDNPADLEAVALREENQKQALAYLDRKLENLSQQEADCQERDARGETARQAAAVLPSRHVLEKIVRYETKLRRQLYCALAQLERVQRMRRGEAVPAPLTVEVSEGA
jgi:hypothetical protein